MLVAPHTTTFLARLPQEPSPCFDRISVVIPAHDEAENLAFLIREIADALKSRSHEIIVVDDGSADGTPQLLRALGRELSALRHIRHAAAAGQSMAVRTGILAATGDVVVTIDGDGQNDPAYILPLVETLEKAGPSVGIVAGQRTGRSDTPAKKLASRLANTLRGAVLNDGTRDTGCGLKAIPVAVVRRLPFFDGWHRFLPALIAREGYVVRHLDVRDRDRRFGRSHYGIFKRGLKGVIDLLGVRWLQARMRTLPVIEEIELDTRA